MSIAFRQPVTPESTATVNPVARLFDIKKMAVHDGPGIRTTVFFKGCPMDCRWCHSPESRSRAVQVRYSEHLCAGCGRCVEACPAACHVLDPDGTHTFRREQCRTCGACAEACPHDALGLIGYNATAEEVFDILIKDQRYFDASGGGVTFSGGEAALQSPFIAALASRLQEAGVPCALDTCGFPPWKRYADMMDFIDLVLFDFKESDPEKHRAHTGVDNKRILENLSRIDGTGTDIHLRCPIIPGLNDEERHFHAIGRLADRYERIREVHVLPFHPFGASKSAMIGERYPLSHLKAVDDDLAGEWVATVQRFTRKPVSRG
ncbi:MAG: glycyl-radical enzyme activating protein [Oceanipulchritudo sp.]